MSFLKFSVIYHSIDVLASLMENYRLKTQTSSFLIFITIIIVTINYNTVMININYQY